jgi:hypothetical protein
MWSFRAMYSPLHLVHVRCFFKRFAKERFSEDFSRLHSCKTVFSFDWWYHYKQGPTHQYVCRELSQDRHVVGNPITRLMVPLTNNFTSVVHSTDGTTSTTLKPSTWQLEFGGNTLGCLHSIIEKTNQSSGHSRMLHRCTLLMCSSHQKAVAKKPNLGTSLQSI